MIEIIIACLISFCAGFGANWALVYFQPPKTVINNFQQQTDVRQIQDTRQDVFQGQVTITIIDGKAASNININIAGITNFTLTNRITTNTNWSKTN